MLTQPTQQYREVKRKANAGERIRIMSAQSASNAYANGSEMTVKLRRDVSPYGVHTNEQPIFVYDSEYVVLEPVEPAFPELLALFIRENAAAVRKYLDEIEAQTSVESTTTQPTPLSRAEVIAKARADVAELERIGRNDRLFLPNESVHWHGRWFEVDFVINREKRAVTALIYELDGWGGTYRRKNRKPDAKATAKASPDDVFHAEIGKAISLRRALGLSVPDEYINAPKPDKPRVGAVVDTARGGEDFRAVLKRRSPRRDDLGCGRAREHSHDTGWVGEEQFDVIDDTDVDYGTDERSAA